MIAPLSALLLAAAPVQDAVTSLTAFETVCVSSAAEMLAADEAAEATGWVWFEDPEEHAVGEIWEYYGRKDDERAQLILSITGEEVTVASCQMASDADFEQLVQGLDSRLGFEAQVAADEAALGWIFTREGDRISPLADVVDLAGLRAAVSPGHPVHLVRVNALSGADDAIRVLTYERFNDFSPQASSPADPKR